MHTIWFREHNRLADFVAKADPSLSDEAVFQGRPKSMKVVRKYFRKEAEPIFLSCGTPPSYKLQKNITPLLCIVTGGKKARRGTTSEYCLQVDIKIEQFLVTFMQGVTHANFLNSSQRVAPHHFGNRGNN